MLLKKVFRDLSQRKFRTILTMVGLAIAVFGITGMAIANESVISSAKMAYGLNTTADGYIFVRESNWNNSILEDVDNSIMIDYEIVYQFFTTTTLQEKKYNIILNGIETERINNANSLFGVILDEGKLPNPLLNETLIDSSAANAFGLNIGDNLVVNLPASNNYSVNSVELTITGLARNLMLPGYTFSSQVNIWLPYSHLQELLEKQNSFTSLYLKTIDNGNKELLVDHVFNKLSEADIFVENKGIIDEENDIRKDMLMIIGIILSFAMILGLLIGGVLTTNTIQMSIANEKKDIALMKINGATKRHIFFTYLLESFTLGFLGAVTGTILSIIGAYIILQGSADPLGLPYLKFVVPLESVVLGFCIPIIIAIVFSLPIIIGTLKISPMEVFRANNSSNNKNTKKSSNRFILQKFSFHNLTRKKFRLVLNIIILTLSVSTVVGFSIAGDSTTDALMDFLDLVPADIMVSTSNVENEKVMTGFLDDFIESKYSATIKSYTTLWWFSGISCYLNTDNNDVIMHSMQLVGVHPDQDAWKAYNIDEGSWLEENKSEFNQIVIASRFVEKNSDVDLSIGQELILGTPMYNHSFEIIGHINDVNNGGMMLYTHISALNDFLQGDDYINSVYIELNDGEGEETEKMIVNSLSDDEFFNAKGWSAVGMSFWKEMNLKQIDFFKLVFNTIGVITLIIAVIGGINTFTMASIEREKEIGILKLTGARPRWISYTFLYEALYIGLISSIFGIFLGRYLIGAIILDILSESFIPIPLTFSGDNLLLGFFVGTVTIIIAAIYPSIKASKTSVIAALRYE